MDQLVRWGDYLALVIFFQQVQDLETTSDEVFSDEMQRRMDVWLATNASIKEVRARLLRCKSCIDVGRTAYQLQMLSNSF